MTPSTTTQRGVGIIGAGRVARDHLYAVQNLPGLRLIGVADPDEGRARRFAQQNGCLAFTDHQALLARDDVDLVLAGVPHWLHASVALDALNASKHVLSEKPMAMTLAECDALIEAAERNRVRLMVGHTQHFFTANLAAKTLIDGGTLGELVLATQHWYKPFGLADRPPWMLDRATGGGMWWMNGAHMLDLLIWLVDSPVVAVKGSVTNRIIGQRAPDSILALIEFANGVYATLAHSGFKRPADHGPAEQYLTCEISGVEGMLKLMPYERRLWLQTAGYYEPMDVERPTEDVAAVEDFVRRAGALGIDAPVARSTVEEIAGVRDELAAFVAAIDARTPLPVSLAHARSVVEVMLAVEHSSATGREVRLD